MNNAEFWVFLAFAFFLILLGKKCYLLIINALDGYITSVKENLSNSKKIKLDSRKNLEKSKQMGDEVQKQIDFKLSSHKSQSQELKEYYQNLLDNYKTSSDKNLESSVKFEENALKKSLLKNIEKDMVEKLKAKFQNKDFDLSVLKKHSSKIEELLK